MLRVFVGALLFLLFTGCSITDKRNVSYEVYKHKKIQKPLPEQKKIVLETKYKLPISGSIKGNITELSFSNEIWSYVVKGSDTTNQKLSIAKFFHNERLAKKGDFIYAIIKNGKLKELFLLKKANFKKSKKIKKNQKKSKKIKKRTYKKSKKHQIIGVPTEESISLD